jgi:hypothetical protein
VDSNTLDLGQGNSLMVKLKQAMNQMIRGKIKTACNSLTAFINQVQDLIAIGVLYPETGQSLILKAEMIITYLQSSNHNN